MRVNLVADVIQSCVVTLDPVAAHIDEWFELEYVPGNGPEKINGNAEVVFDVEDDDPPETMHGGAFDIGEAIAERLALLLDDYPRKPGAEFTDTMNQTDDRAIAEHPFAVLKDRHEET